MPNARILVVEDDAIVAMDIASVLRRLGYDVIATVRSAEAIAISERQKPDLVLMDIRLSGKMNGIEAAEEIRKRVGSPVIFLTAQGDNAYVVKPFEDSVMRRVVELALSRSREDRDALWYSEERLRLLLDGVPDIAIYFVDVEGRIVSWNRAAERMTGYAAGEIVGQSTLLLINEEERDPHKLANDLAQARQFGRFEEEGTRLRKDGTPFLAHLVRTPVSDRSGTFIGFATVMQDITDRRALEAQLLHSQKLETLGKLAGGIAHDFNNMLMVIFSRVELLLRMSHDEREQRYLGDIRMAAQKSRDLTQQLLAAARRQILMPEVVDLGEIVTSAMQLLTVSLGEDIAIRNDFEPQLWPVHADPSKLHQIVLNLAVNSRDAMPSGGILTIETRNFRADAAYVRQHPAITEGEYVMLVVSDTGVGIPPNLREQVFDPFFTTKEAGTGLGLAVVRSIVEQTGGHLWLYSEVGQGTTFKIVFPRFKDAPARLERIETEDFDRGSETVLLVEDETLLRTILQETLEEHGYRVLAAASPSEAVVISDRFPERIDLLLTDVVMPGMNGRILAGELRLRRDDLKVVYMSGYTDDVMIHHGVLDETVIFLEKPATTSRLLKTVRAALDR